ncbi:P-loop containing nucleoside triphosphate hydrolase protein [Auricularia subglabra TFB-10046 SS5]|uniref:DNA 3'-5' helicase n=1 Tax=Auricularia subglabra (strain TFB-10046 / SS5) TaxID=717982 RepID=J0WP67_AURST|nr:P-loop containing nucleoside triphosphate hydrolase protein [Auricularia subglabra TFB-10046 SS5]
MLASLRAFLRCPTATFRSNGQRRGMEAVITGDCHTAIVLPTNGGKSMLWTLSSAHYDDATAISVVFVPWIVLALSHLRSCVKAGISASLWTKESPVFSSVTFVLPESGSSDSFHAGLRELSATGRLKRFFIDEVHAWIMDQDYRPAFLDASSLVAYAKPIHMLSATIPMDVFRDALVLLRVADVAAPVVIRERSIRPSIRYSVVYLCQSDFLGYIITAAQRLLTLPEHRAIVFVRTIDEAVAVANSLGCLAFHSKLSPHDRDGTLKTWETGGTRILVATTLLSTGFHLPGVRLVVEYGASWNYITHAQGTGRGGRDDHYCEAITLLDRRANYTVRRPDLYGHQEMMDCFMDTSQCLRYGISLYLDGFGERCNDLPLEFVPCSRCEQEHPVQSQSGTYNLRPAPLRELSVSLVEPQCPQTNVILRVNAELVAIQEQDRLRAHIYLKERLDTLT